MLSDVKKWYFCYGYCSILLLLCRIFISICVFLFCWSLMKCWILCIAYIRSFHFGRTYRWSENWMSVFACFFPFYFSLLLIFIFPLTEVELLMEWNNVSFWSNQSSVMYTFSFNLNDGKTLETCLKIHHNHNTTQCI